MRIDEVISYIKCCFNRYKFKKQYDSSVGNYLIVEHGFVKLIVKIQSDESIYIEVLKHYDYSFNNKSMICNTFDDIYSFMELITDSDYNKGRYD